MKRAKGEDVWHVDPILVAEDHEARQRFKQQRQYILHLDPKLVAEDSAARRRIGGAIDLTKEDN